MFWTLLVTRVVRARSYETIHLMMILYFVVQECQRLMEQRWMASKERVANLEEEVETKHTLTIDLTKQIGVNKLILSFILCC